MKNTITREEAEDMAEAHAQGFHDLKREGCPECEDRPLSEYPSYASIRQASEEEAREEFHRSIDRQWQAWEASRFFEAG
jgi:hypothetical protein